MPEIFGILVKPVAAGVHMPEISGIPTNPAAGRSLTENSDGSRLPGCPPGRSEAGEGRRQQGGVGRGGRECGGRVEA